MQPSSLTLSSSSPQVTNVSPTSLNSPSPLVSLATQGSTVQDKDKEQVAWVDGRKALVPVPVGEAKRLKVRRSSSPFLAVPAQNEADERALATAAEGRARNRGVGGTRHARELGAALLADEQRCCASLSSASLDLLSSS